VSKDGRGNDLVGKGADSPTKEEKKERKNENSFILERERKVCLRAMETSTHPRLEEGCQPYSDMIEEGRGERKKYQEKKGGDRLGSYRPRLKEKNKRGKRG